MLKFRNFIKEGKKGKKTDRFQPILKRTPDGGSNSGGGVTSDVTSYSNSDV